MSSIDSIVAALRTAVDALRHAAAHAQNAEAGAAELRDLGASVGMRDVAERMGLVGEHAKQAAGTISAAIGLVEETIVRADALRGAGGASAANAQAPGSAPLSGSVLGEALSALPVRRDNAGPTSGCLFDEHGRPVSSATIRSSRDETLTADLELPRRAQLSEAMSSHVEAKVAAMMRRDLAPRNTVLVINNARGPCGWLMRQRGQRRFGTTCDELLPDVLPVGSVLTVLWRDEQGIERSEVYRGTGRRIKG